MNRKHWLQTAAYLVVMLPAAMTHAQTRATSWRLSGIEAAGAPRLTVSADSNQALVFSPGGVGGASQQLTAIFHAPDGDDGVIPTAVAHYGHDFTVGQPTCTWASIGRTCAVAVNFTPTLPGARPDALFLMNGSQRLTTVLLKGTGQSPLALFEPVAGKAGSDGLAAVDELGMLYLLDRNLATVTSITQAGEKTVLPLTGLGTPRSLALDGAGVLYILTGSAEKSLITYDTVRGIQGSFALPLTANSFDSIALNMTGDLTAYASTMQAFYTVNSAGAATKTPLAASSVTSNGSIILKPDGSLYAGGNSIQQIDRSGNVTHLKTSGAAATTEAATSAAAADYTPLAVDAAGTVYARGDGAILVQGEASSGTLPDALAMAADGSLYGSDGARLDRTQATLNFDGVIPGSTSDAKLATLYNAGNLPLAIAAIALDGTGYEFALEPVSTCAGGAILAPSASCTLAITMHAEKTELQTGAVTITTNSLNGANTISTLAMTAHPNAATSQAVFNPTTLAFPSTTVLVASAPLTVTLSNPGAAALNIGSIALTGAGSASYSLTQNCYTAAAPSLAAGGQCTISVIFKPLTAAAQAASISVIDDLGGVANSAQTVAITGTGTAAPAPVITATYSTTYTASTLTFGNPPTLTVPILSNVVVVGTVSNPGTITLTNTGNATLNISSIALAITGTSTTLPFTQTNNCGATLAAAAKCVVTVIFSPVASTTTTANIYAAIATTAAVVVTDNSLGSPHSFAIAGYPTAADYTMSSTVTTITIPSTGGTAQIPLTATPDPAPFPTPIDFTVYNMPTGATYNFSPTSITAVTSASSSALNITLPAYHPVTLAQLSPHSPFRHPYAPLTAVALTGLCLGLRRRRLSAFARLLPLVLLGALGLGALSISGCTGGYPMASGVAPGTYSLVITAASANGLPSTVAPFPVLSTHTVNVNLIVQ